MSIDTDTKAFYEIVLDALDVPPAARKADEEEYYRLLERRAGHVREVLRAALDGNDLAHECDYLFERIAELPATGYRHFADEPDEDEP